MAAGLTGIRAGWVLLLVNWLTERLADLPSLDGLARLGSQWRNGLRTIDAGDVFSEVRSLDVTVAEGGLDLSDYFLFIADGPTAAGWRDGARPASPRQARPADFTVALDDGYGTVVYLPDDIDPSPTLQLFGFVDGGVTRVRVAGEFDSSTARLSDWVESPLRDLCRPGPCPMPECPEGCDCVKTDPGATVGEARLAALPPRYFSGPGYVYTYCCLPSD
jgi:hypothetical protein